MTSAQTQQKVAAIGNWPLPEDRKAAVVVTDVGRGILDETQARDACRGGQSIDTKIDTPDPKDPLVGSLATDATKQTQKSANNFEPATGDLDPTTSGEAAARTLDKEVQKNLANADDATTGFISAEDKVQPKK